MRRAWVGEAIVADGVSADVAAVEVAGANGSTKAATLYGTLDVASAAGVSRRTAQKVMQAKDARIDHFIRSGELSATAAADIARHEDVAEQLRITVLTPEQAVEKVKERRPPSKLDLRDAQIGMLERRLADREEELEDIKRENTFLKVMMGDEDLREEAARAFGSQRRMLTLMVKVARMWMEEYGSMQAARDYWRDKARESGFKPRGREALEVRVVNRVDSTEEANIKRTDDAFTLADEILLVEPFGVGSDEALVAPPGKGLAPLGENLLAELGLDGYDLEAYGVDRDNPRDLERVMRQIRADEEEAARNMSETEIDDLVRADESAMGVSDYEMEAAAAFDMSAEDYGDGYGYGDTDMGDLEDMDDSAAYEDTSPDGVEDEPDPAFGQMALGGDVGNSGGGHERPSGYRPLARPPRYGEPEGDGGVDGEDVDGGTVGGGG